jgi:HlyD family secretion protein
MKTPLAVLGLLLFLGLVGGTLVFLYQQAQPLTPTYQTTTVTRRTIVDKAIATGAIVPRKEIAIKSQVRGVVETLFVQPGQLVNAGDAIARIRVIANPVEVNRAEFEFKKAQLELKAATEELRLTQALFKKGSSNIRELNERQLRYDIAQANVHSTQNNLELIRAGVSKSLPHTATLVRATIAGMLLDRPVEEGNFVIESNTFNEGTTVATVADMQNLLFKGMVTETEAGRLHEGMTLDITIGALADERFEATLEFISPKATNAEGSVTFEIHAALRVQPDRVVRAGYSATADIIFARRVDVVAIPERYLIFREGKTFIMVEVAPDISELREVTTGISDGIDIEITSHNLWPGDRLVSTSNKTDEM